MLKGITVLSSFGYKNDTYLSPNLQLSSWKTFKQFYGKIVGVWCDFVYLLMTTSMVILWCRENDKGQRRQSFPEIEKTPFCLDIIKQWHLLCWYSMLWQESWRIYSRIAIDGDISEQYNPKITRLIDCHQPMPLPTEDILQIKFFSIPQRW